MIHILKAATKNSRAGLELKMFRQLPVLLKQLKLIILKKSSGVVIGIMALRNN